jgi:hypothetical protein
MDRTVDVAPLELMLEAVSNSVPMIEGETIVINSKYEYINGKYLVKVVENDEVCACENCAFRDEGEDMYCQMMGCAEGEPVYLVKIKE